MARRKSGASRGARTDMGPVSPPGSCQTPQPSNLAVGSASLTASGPWCRGGWHRRPCPKAGPARPDGAGRCAPRPVALPKINRGGPRAPAPGDGTDARSSDRRRRSHAHRAGLQGLARPASPGRDGGLCARRAPGAQPRPRSGAGRGGLLRRRPAPGLQGFNLARIMVLLSERLPDSVNGATVSRYCASSLETIRQAANAVGAGQGDAYVAAGVEWVSRYNESVEGARPQDQNEKLQGRNGQPDAYISDGADRRERGRALRGQPGGHGQVRPALPGARGSLTGGRLLRPRDRPRHACRRHRGGQGRRPAGELEPGEARGAGSRLQGGRQGHGRQLVSAERRRRRGARDVGGQGRGARICARAPGSSPPPRRPSSPSTWAWRRSGPSARCSSAPA